MTYRSTITDSDRSNPYFFYTTNLSLEPVKERGLAKWLGKARQHRTTSCSVIRLAGSGNFKLSWLSVGIYESDDVAASCSILGIVPDLCTYAACDRSKSNIAGSVTMLRSCRYMERLRIISVVDPVGKVFH